MNFTKAIIVGAIFLVGVTALTQEWTKWKLVRIIPTCASPRAAHIRKGTALMAGVVRWFTTGTSTLA